MKRELQVDRTEGKTVVLMDGEDTFFEIALDFFDTPPREGDYFEIDFEDGAPVSSRFLEEKTEAARQRIRALMAKMRKKK